MRLLQCKAAIDMARRQVATMIGAQPDEVYFTASGSESDHWAIWGARPPIEHGISGQSATPHVVTSAIEHPAVLQYLRTLAKEVQTLSHTLIPCLHRSEFLAIQCKFSAEAG